MVKTSKDRGIYLAWVLLCLDRNSYKGLSNNDLGIESYNSAPHIDLAIPFSRIELANLLNHFKLAFSTVEGVNRLFFVFPYKGSRKMSRVFGFLLI